MTVMGSSPDLYWLPQRPEDWRQRVLALSAASDLSCTARWAEAVTLSRYRLDFTATNALDAAIGTLQGEPAIAGLPSERLAVLSSSTAAHLASGLRVAALRRGIKLSIYQPDYAQYRQVLADRHSDFFRFAPSVVMFALDSGALAHIRAAKTRAEAKSCEDALIADLRSLWHAARDKTGAIIIQQSFMPRWPDVAGSNEHRVPGSLAAFVTRVNTRLREASDDAGIDLLAVDTRVAQDGLARWYSETSWQGAKQEVALSAAPIYGDMVMRLITARRGRSAKCCVLDLDNTLWGGVVGDDGARGLVLGQGSVAGEAFVELQLYARDLSRRGVLLAICSKNEEAIALDIFDTHPEMVLKRADIACFAVDWQDKATNLRMIAQKLNIGLDACVFVDDNPFERALVRDAVPEVFVPEIPEDPALVPRCLADSGAFEMVALTEEDLRRTELYATNIARDKLLHEATNLEAFLIGLDMRLIWRKVTDVDIARVTQLINKTNQFNLTTRRLGEDEVRKVMHDGRCAALQFRLIDRLADHGIIAVVMGHLAEEASFVIDDWLMSCRVIGRGVEEATLNVVAARAKAFGAATLLASYRPTGRNGMVADLLARLGFEVTAAPDQSVAGSLDLVSFTARETAMRIEEAA